MTIVVIFLICWGTSYCLGIMFYAFLMQMGNYASNHNNSNTQLEKLGISFYKSDDSDEILRVLVFIFLPPFFVIYYSFSCWVAKYRDKLQKERSILKLIVRDNPDAIKLSMKSKIMKMFLAEYKDKVEVALF